MTYLFKFAPSFIAVASILSIGCSATDVASDNEGASVEDGVAETSSALQSIDSKFTSIKPQGCTKLEEGPAYVKFDCGGLAGYRIITEDADLRANVQVATATKEMDLNVWSGKIGNGGFTSLGDTVDWRGVVNGTTFTPFAITFRVTSQNVQYLVVSKISKTQSCQFKVFNASKHPDANTLARQTADAARTAACPTSIPDPE
ncbi:hypothetical protein [Pendulispora albinea]|uniref:Secreted protein n=1 Tax=Pendulispora albinea TaxID=2741071 RepID=A0ABZ2LXI5_9BACT